jgi:hypothetical protein
MSRRLAWMLAAPLALWGSQLAHALGYVAVAPRGEERAHLLATTGHGYQQHLPLVAALAATLCIAALVTHFVGARRGAAGRLGAATFALVPLTVFPIQEHAERWLHDGQVPWTAVLAPTFAVGLALQLPFALLAYAVARTLLRATDALARRPLLEGLLELPRSSVCVRPPLAVALPRPVQLARGYAERGPPLSA